MYLLVLLLWVIFVMASFILIDVLLYIEFNSHRDSWEKDLKPHGIFFYPKEVNLGPFVHPMSTVALLRLSIKWIFLTPKWAVLKKKNVWLFRIYRIAVLSQLIPFLILIFRK